MQITSFSIKSEAWNTMSETLLPLSTFLTLSWSISVSPVMTILFSMRVSEIPPFTVYNRDKTQAKIQAGKNLHSHHSFVFLELCVILISISTNITTAECNIKVKNVHISKTVRHSWEQLSGWIFTEVILNLSWNDNFKCYCRKKE